MSGKLAQMSFEIQGLHKLLREQQYYVRVEWLGTKLMIWDQAIGEKEDIDVNCDDSMTLLLLEAS